MRFGIFDNVERRHDVGHTQQYHDRLRLIEMAESAGIYCYHVGEHHNTRLSIISSQSVFLAAAAQRTKTMRLGTLVYVLPLHHPLRLIEEVCISDHLSNGRFEVGVGRGADQAIDWRMWGGELEENDARFEENLSILIEGLGTDFLTHEGRFYSFKDLWMELRPLQQPRPPFWWAGNATHAGERGMNFVGGRESIPMLAESVEEYLLAFNASPQRHLAGREEPLYGARKHVLVADSDGEAVERARAAYGAMMEHYYKPIPGERYDPDYIPPPTRVSFERALEIESLIAGSPDTVRDYLQRYAEGSGANYFVAVFHWGDLTHDEAARSLELFASDVMPAIP